MDLARQKELVARLLTKNSVAGRVTVKNEALNLDDADRSATVRVKILSRVAEASDDASTCEAIISTTPFHAEGGELTVGTTTYDIIKVTQTGVGAEHLIQRAVLRER